MAINQQHLSSMNQLYHHDGHGLSRKQQPSPPPPQQQSLNNYFKTILNRMMIISNVDDKNHHHHHLHNNELRCSTTMLLDPIINDEKWNISNQINSNNNVQQAPPPATTKMLKKFQLNSLTTNNDSGMFSSSSSSSLSLNSFGISNGRISQQEEDDFLELSSSQQSIVSIRKQSVFRIPGSLESINLDEDQDSDSDFLEPPITSPSSSSLSSTSSDQIELSWTLSPLYEQNSPSSLNSLNSLDSDFQTSDSLPSFANETFIQSLQYPCWNDLCLYSNLNRLFNHNGNDSCSGMSKSSLSLCSRFVNRFGNECIDICRFPLVLPVFQADLLERRKSFITWKQLILEADACLSIWELSALKNLYHRFDNQTQTIGVALGKPIDWIQIDPNYHLRQICQQLKNHTAIKQDKHQVLKRWSSMEDLYFGKQNNQTGSNYKTDDSIDTIDCSRYNRLKQSNNRILSLSSTKLNNRTKKFRETKSKSIRSNTTFNKLYSSIKSLNNRSEKYCNIVYRELSSLLQYSSAVHFALYVTKFHQEYFRHRLSDNFFNICTKLILPKQNTIVDDNVVVVDCLYDLLKFDDIVVDVIRDHMFCTKSINNNNDNDRIRFLINLIESACLLRQLRNFHGLQLMIGAIQSPRLYFDHQYYWRLLQQTYPIHYRDYQCLSMFCRQLSCSNSMLSCINFTHLPPIHSILNRLRLSCAQAWNIYDANIRFTNGPSMAKWVETQINDGNRKKSTIKKSNKLQVNLQIDFEKKTFLQKCSNDTSRVINFNDYPQHIGQRRRYIGTIPDGHLRWLIQPKIWSTFVEYEANQSFIDYELPDKFY
ncbi:uncharacterized protein LOC113794635 isoform X2 [Dermatophagoides pteronyssinus]|uniref:uncharacterized protein LOC113794635 isoform X2 n=1 Tax=Dermatophagoides pteronyssinus TaxID=6956 RepID=UPI003F67887A